MANRKKSSGRPALQPGRPAREHSRKAQGNFSGAGEHPLVGGRTTGIVGQTRQKFQVDKGSDPPRGSTKQRKK